MVLLHAPRREDVEELGLAGISSGRDVLPRGLPACIRCRVARVRRLDIVADRRTIVVVGDTVAKAGPLADKRVARIGDALSLDQQDVGRVRHAAVAVADLGRHGAVADIGEVGELRLGAERQLPARIVAMLYVIAPDAETGLHVGSPLHAPGIVPVEQAV